MKKPNMVVCNSKGEVFEIPELLMAGASAGKIVVPDTKDLVALPQSSVFHVLPKRLPVGYDPVTGQFVALREYAGQKVFAAAAFMPPGYVQTHFSAYEEMGGAPKLPLFCYAALGFKSGKFYAAGFRIDKQLRHEIADESLALIDAKAVSMRKRHAGNRLVAHLVDNCVLQYRCPNACNLVLGKWECPIPVSTACNASCLGCISKQPKSSCIPSTQQRLDFVPTVGEIVEYVVPHLQRANNPIASFGQGCEGEPLLSADIIEESIREIRLRTTRGIINCNTNASKPRAIERLCKAGLNSMRVSMNSAQKPAYHAYYRPRGFSFDDVVKSIVVAKKHGVWVSINYLVFPGFTDNTHEIKALKQLLAKTKINMIQTRNLNIDPLWYMREMGLGKGSDDSIGMKQWQSEIQKRFTDLNLGYFNPTFKTMIAK